MPARFVEVANFAGAARTSEALSYLPWLLPNSTTLLLSPGSLWRLGSSNSSSSGLLQRSVAAAARVECPAAKLMLLLAVALLAARFVLVHVMAQKALVQFGHSRFS